MFLGLIVIGETEYVDTMLCGVWDGFTRKGSIVRRHWKSRVYKVSWVG